MVVRTEWLGCGCGSALGLLCSLSRDFANVPEGREAVARQPLRGVDLSVLDSELQGWWLWLSGLDGQPFNCRFGCK